MGHGGSRRELKASTQKLTELAAAKQSTHAAVALGWLLHHPAGVVPITGRGFMPPKTLDVTRRQFLNTSASVAAAIASSGKAWSAAGEPARGWYGNPLEQSHYRQGTLQPGLHQSQLEQTHNILMGLNEDSLLRPFRMAAGLPAPGWADSVSEPRPSMTCRVWASARHARPRAMRTPRPPRG